MKQIIFCLALACGFTATAQDSPAEVGSQASATNDVRGSLYRPWAAGRLPGLGVVVNYSYVASSDIAYRATRGSSDAHAIHSSVTGQIAITDKWFVPVGLRSENLFLGTVAGAPIPDRINLLNLTAGAGCHLNNQWTVAASVGPVLYRFDDISGNDLGIAGAIRAAYTPSPELTLALGLAFAPDSEIPVLPLVGLRWTMTTNLTLNLMFPRPVLVYRLDSRLNLFVGGGGDFAVFRTESDFGNRVGQSRYNNALGTYRDFHLGGGAEYHLPLGASISVEAGCSFARQIDYKDIGETVSFDPGPYVQAGLGWRF